MNLKTTQPTLKYLYPHSRYEGKKFKRNKYMKDKNTFSPKTSQNDAITATSFIEGFESNTASTSNADIL